MHFYRQVPEDVVARPVLHAAGMAYQWATWDLGLVRRPLPIRWFVESAEVPTLDEQLLGMRWFERESRVDGITGKGQIWVRADLTPLRAAFVALHEACHVFQQQLVGMALGDLEYDGRERQAEAYASGFADLARSVASVAEVPTWTQ